MNVIMKIHLYLLLTFCCLFQIAFAQQIQKASIYPNNPQNGNYLWVEPLSNKIDAVLFLLPGFGQAPGSIFTESKLPYVAAVNNILTVAASGGMTMFVDDRLTNHLNLVIHRIIEQYPEIENKPWVMGGFSAGGTISLRYIENCQENREKCPVQFEGVFAVDSPVDLVEIWKYCDRELARNYSEIGMQEAKMVQSVFTRQLGTPEQEPERYAELTPFDIQAPLGKGNEVWLKDLAVRVYHDIDVNWQIQNRRRSAYESNFLQSSELINRLYLLGNERAAFIQATGKGYRSDGRRHTHSWSIVDEVECIQWVNGICKTQ